MTTASAPVFNPPDTAAKVLPKQAGFPDFFEKEIYAWDEADGYPDGNISHVYVRESLLRHGLTEEDLKPGTELGDALAHAGRAFRIYFPRKVAQEAAAAVAANPDITRGPVKIASNDEGSIPGINAILSPQDISLGATFILQQARTTSFMNR